MKLKVKKSENFISFLKFLHFFVSVLLFLCSWLVFRYKGHLPAIYKGMRYDLFILVGYSAMLYFFNQTYTTYLLGYFRMRELAFSQCLSDLMSVGLLYVLVTLGWWQLRSPLPFIVLLIVQAAFNAFWTWLANLVYFDFYRPVRCIVIYRKDTDLRRLGKLKGKPLERRFQIDKYLKYTGNSFQDIREEILPYGGIFVTGLEASVRNDIAKYCAENNISGFFLPHLGDIILQGGMHIKSFSSPVLAVERKKANPAYLFVKRALDIIISFTAIVVLSPFFIILSAIIHFYDNGPAFYKQVRLTKDGREFTLYKFRSMRVDAEADGKARLSTGKKDDRITPVGRFIRACRLDEFPQLINILIGDMSFVGPRPERPEIAAKYEEKLPEFSLRLQVKAGLTGYAQIYGKYNSEPYEKLGFDLLYINNMNLVTDLQMLFATVKVLFSPESTEGFEEQVLD